MCTCITINYKNNKWKHKYNKKLLFCNQFDTKSGLKEILWTLVQMKKNTEKLFATKMLHKLIIHENMRRQI